MTRAERAAEAARRACPSCSAYLRSDNDGPLCSPCERGYLAPYAERTPAEPQRTTASLMARREQIVRLLKNGPMSVQELVDATGTSKATIYSDVRAMAEAETVEQRGWGPNATALWRLPESDYEALMGARDEAA